MTDAQILREQAARYRKLLTTIDDMKTRDVLAALATECDSKADAAEQSDPVQQTEQQPPDQA